jgi:hypothetical protein
MLTIEAQVSDSSSPEELTLWPGSVDSPGGPISWAWLFGLAAVAALLRGIAYLDSEIGNLLNRLRDLGLYENTLIIILRTTVKHWASMTCCHMAWALFTRIKYTCRC